MGSITRAISEFATGTEYSHLPASVIRESKRLLLDTIGCALGGINTTKGALAIQMAKSLGGPPEASLLGTGDKVSAASSAYAMGELMTSPPFSV